MAVPNEKSETGCCPRLNPDLWNEKEITWENKLFLKDRLKSIFHIPLNFGKHMTKNMAQIEKAEALASDNITLTDEISLWGADLYIAVDKEVPGATMARISGTFLTKVFEGSFQNLKTWISDMEEFVKSKGKVTKKMYFYYTTCPKCAQAYGKNYTVILAEI